jgi:inner membrane protein
MIGAVILLLHIPLGMFFVLKSQDFALLAGTVALFAVLAAGMFLTRRMDRWGGNHLADEPAQS